MILRERAIEQVEIKLKQPEIKLKHVVWACPLGPSVVQNVQTNVIGGCTFVYPHKSMATLTLLMQLYSINFS